MTIFVTGSAVFIGENLILDELGACDETAASVEKLTDAGNLQNLTGLEGDALTSSQLIAAQANRKRLKLTCPEEITFRQQWISAEQLYALTTSADQKWLWPIPETPRVETVYQ
ncbi:dTDP-D-glucose 4,6-dehydratase [Pseudomonas sp. JAI115]|uniref:hypothetical protein n=1 Tax=Pseudomonas sp. JAI115 TaxID=2723061 RepID=UPI00161E3622|nr:dTDP-D-glucose 4,6-dehydratase [Pseudomonas sp. JAI115]